MDRELPSEVVRSRQIKKIMLPIIILASMILSVMIFRAVLSPSLKISSVKLALAETGSIEDAITASGTVIPEYEQIITSPIKSGIAGLQHKAGDHVEPGESLIKLNKEFALLDYNRMSDELDLKLNQKIKLELEIQRILADLNTQYEIKKLKIKFDESRLGMEEKLMNLGVGSREAYDVAKLSLEISRKELEYLEEQMENQRQSLKADLREHVLIIQIAERNLEELRRQLELAEVKSDISGVVTWVDENIGAAVKPGDILAKVADLSSFKIEAKISDIHAGKLSIGSPVRVRIENTDLPGIIDGIRPTIINGIVTFTVALDENNHPKLRSNLRVDVFVILDVREDIIRVENGPFVNGSGIQDIFVVEGNKAVRKTVTIGATNFDFVEILDFVDPGDKVIISDMEKYIHHQEINLNYDILDGAGND